MAEQATEASSSTLTQLIKCKCVACGLHFTVFSWYHRWAPRYCPECGQTESFMIWQDASPEPIFRHVPGSSPIVSLP